MSEFKVTLDGGFEVRGTQGIDPSQLLVSDPSTGSIQLNMLVVILVHGLAIMGSGSNVHDCFGEADFTALNESHSLMSMFI